MYRIISAGNAIHPVLQKGVVWFMRLTYYYYGTCTCTCTCMYTLLMMCYNLSACILLYCTPLTLCANIQYSLFLFFIFFFSVQNVILQDGYRFPANLDTPGAIGKVLAQQPGKAKASELRQGMQTHVHVCIYIHV